MPSAGIEPAFQASEACVLSVALRGQVLGIKEFSLIFQQTSLYDRISSLQGLGFK